MMFREMRRDKQQLSEDECKTILKEEKRGVLAVNGLDGYPYAIPMDYYYAEDKNALYFHCAKEGHKVDALKENNHVSFCVMGKDTQKEDWAPFVKSVVIFGTMKVEKNREDALQYLTKIAYKYFPDTEDRDGAALRSVDRIHVLKLSIDHMTGKEVHEK